MKVKRRKISSKDKKTVCIEVNGIRKCEELMLGKLVVRVDAYGRNGVANSE